MSRASFLLAALFLAKLAATTATASLNGLPGCQTRCGEVDIPYPFGFGNNISTSGANCSLPGFEIACVKNGSGVLMPVLGEYTQTQIQVLNLSATPLQVLSLTATPRPEARVMLPVAYQCYNSSGYYYGNYSYGSVALNRTGVYRISNSSNELFVLGCNTLVYTDSGNSSGGRFSYMYYTGCVAYANDSRSAQDGVCSGVGCCHVNIPPGLTDNLMTFHGDNGWSHADQEFCPCDYAFIVEKGYYTFRASDLTSMPLNQAMPLRLDWAIRDSTGSAMSLSCANAPKSPGYTCVSGHSECVDSTNGPGYVCNCNKGYEGNPYLVNGCTNINECARSRQEFPCNGVCHDTEGSYDCKCPPGYGSNGDPTENPCDPKFPHATKLALGITLGVSFLIVALLLALTTLQKRRLQDELFKKNGGKVLQNVKGLKIFTREELKKITKNNSEFLGKGSFGEVYKGTLPDETMVAVKASIEVNEARKEEFTEEVEIQTQMIHKNILKLLGCCLEVDVPMLVYEFAANGSLKDILHGKKIHKLPLDVRLDIAIGSAEGLKYMHSYTTQAIRHGDVKPDNILLDDELIPKISDFGLSKILKVAVYFTDNVVGCMAYIDPVFLKTGLLTQKSDVYSFGAVLLELITRKQNVYDENRSLIIEFRKVYEKEKSGRAMFDKEISAEEDIFILEQIGKLAMECLKEDDVADRPDMTEVAEQLVMIRRDRKHVKAPNKSPRHFEDIAAVDDSTSGTTSTATFSEPSTPTSKDFSANP